MAWCKFSKYYFFYPTIINPVSHSEVALKIIAKRYNSMKKCKLCTKDVALVQC